MSNYFNADGEPTMTAATARFEADLDASAYYASDYPATPVDEDYFYDHPDECPHDDRTYLGSSELADNTTGDVRCDLCDRIVGTWVRGDDGWPEVV